MVEGPGTKPITGLYCKKSNLKMARQLQRKHIEETDVAYAFSFPFGSKQRKTLLESLRNKGDWQHNLKVLEEGNGELVTWKKPSKKASVKDYLPCQHCYAMFKRTEQKASSQLLPIMESSEGIQTVIHSMLLLRQNSYK